LELHPISLFKIKTGANLTPSQLSPMAENSNTIVDFSNLKPAFSYKIQAKCGF
jgi:hypothetical protein